MSSYYEKFPGGKVVCIDEEIPFEVPQGWEWCRIKNICTVVGRIGFRGYTKEDLVAPGMGAISISPSNMGIDGLMHFSDCTYISWGKYEESPEIMIDAGDILVVKTGSSYGKSCMVESLPEKATINPQIAVLKSVLLDKRWLITVLNSPLCRTQFERYVLGTSIPTFSQEKLGNTLIPVSPSQETTRIVDIVRRLRPLTNSYQRTYCKLQDLNESLYSLLKKSVLNEAVQGRLVPQDPDDEPAAMLLEKISTEKQRLVKEGKLKAKDAVSSIIFKGDDNKYYEQIGSKTQKFDGEIPFELPDSWTWTRVSSLAKLISGTSFDKADVSSEGIRILRGGNIVEYSIEFRDDDIFLPKRYVDNEKNISDGDIVIVASTGSLTAIGRPAFVHGSYNNIQIGAFLRIVRPLHINVSQWLSLIFETTYYRDHISDCVKGTSINNIKADYVLNMLVPLPPKQEQQRIVQKIAEIQTLIQ